MLIVPAIYIQKGRCVSLYKGQETVQKKIYPGSPVNWAKSFERKGCSLIHVIDLDASQQGDLQNFKIIQKICEVVKVPISVGGAIRSIEMMETIFKMGVKKVVLGVTARFMVEEAIYKYGADNIFFGIKARREWVESDSLPEEADEVIEIAEQMAKKGVTQIVYNDMERQGTLYHPNYDEVDRLISTLNAAVKVFSSGGVVATDDLRILNSINSAGAIISRAFMEYKLNLNEEIDRFEHFH